MKQLNDNLGLIVTIIAIIGGIVPAIRFFIKKWHTYKLKANASFQGCWSNGGVYENNPSHYLDIEIYGSNNEIRGTVNVRKWDDNDNWYNVFLSGKRTFKIVKCQIIDTKSFDKNVIGTVSLTKKKKNLCWQMKHQESEIFPNRELLHKDLPKVF